LEELVPGIKTQKVPLAGTPLVIIISGTNLRVIEIARELRKIGPNFVVSELFAKHKTLEEQVNLLYKIHPHVVVGTIDRIQKLIHGKALNLFLCKLLVLDMVRNQKSYSLLDNVNESQRPIFELYWNYFHSSVKEGKVKLCLY